MALTLKYSVFVSPLSNLCDLLLFSKTPYHSPKIASSLPFSPPSLPAVIFTSHVVALEGVSRRYSRCPSCSKPLDSAFPTLASCLPCSSSRSASRRCHTCPTLVTLPSPISPFLFFGREVSADLTSFAESSSAFELTRTQLRSVWHRRTVLFSRLQ